MKRRLFLLVLVWTGAILVAQLWTRNKDVNVSLPKIEELPPVTSIVDTAPAPQTETEKTPAPQVESQQSPVPLKDKIKNMKLTSLNEYRDDARKNPHRPSEKMYGVVAALGDLMNSVKSETDAREVVDYYRSCLKSDTPTSLKVTCYRYSQEIAKTYPALAKDVASLENDLSPDARMILQRSRR